MDWRGVGLAVGLLILGGCTNLVYSEQPLFVAENPPPLVFRPGLWASPRPGCDFEPAKPFEEWPDCAGGGYLDAQGRDSASARPAVLVAGEPMIAQDGPMAAAKGPFRYMYWAFRPLRLDPQGRAIEVALWFVQCGPPQGASPKANPAFHRDSNLTRHPLPGLVLKDSNCLASDAAAVRNAAAASLEWAPPVTTYWVRDGVN